MAELMRGKKGLIMGVAFGVFSTLSQTTVQNNQLARSQAGARVALEEIERALRSAGAEVDLTEPMRLELERAAMAVFASAVPVAGTPFLVDGMKVTLLPDLEQLLGARLECTHPPEELLG